MCWKGVTISVMAKAISIIFTIILLPTFFVCLFLISLKFTIFNPGFIKNELKSHNAYTVIHNNFSEIGTSIIGGDGKDANGAPVAGAENANPFSQADTIAFAQNVLTPQLMQKETESFIDSVWPWLFSGKKLAPVATGDLKDNIYNGIMAQFRAKYSALPVCSYPGQFTMNLGTCRIAGVSFDDLVKQAQMQKFGNTTMPLFAVNSISDNFNISQAASNNPKLGNSFQNLSGAQSWLSPITKNFYFIPAVLLIILLLLARLFAGAWKKTPMIFGIYLIIITGLFYLISFLETKFGFSWLINFADSKITALPNIKTQLVIPMVRDIAAKVERMNLEIMIIAIIIGIILISGNVVLKKFFEKKANDIGKPALTETTNSKKE